MITKTDLHFDAQWWSTSCRGQSVGFDLNEGRLKLFRLLVTTQMLKILFGIVLSNIINGVLVLAIGFLLLIGVKSGLHISIPVGAAAIAADRGASTTIQAIMLISTLMAALITGFISLPLIDLGAGLSGPLSCIAVAGCALIELVSNTTPGHDDLPRLLK